MSQIYDGISTGEHLDHALSLQGESTVANLPTPEEELHDAVYVIVNASASGDALSDGSLVYTGDLVICLQDGSSWAWKRLASPSKGTGLTWKGEWTTTSTAPSDPSPGDMYYLNSANNATFASIGAYSYFFWAGSDWESLETPGALTYKGTWSTASSTPPNPQNGWAYRYTNSNPMTVAPYCSDRDILYYADIWRRLTGDYGLNYRGTHSQAGSVPTGTLRQGYWYRYAGSSKMTVTPYCSPNDILFYDGSYWHAIGVGLGLVNSYPVAGQNIYAPTTVKGSTSHGILASGTTSSPEPVWKEYPGDGAATSPSYSQADPGTSTSGTFRNYYAQIPVIGDSKAVFLLLNWGMFVHSEDQVVSVTFSKSYPYKNYALFFQDARNADGAGFTNGYSVYTTSTTGCTVKCRNYTGRAFYVAVGVCY